MSKLNADEFIYQLSVWERLLKQLVDYPAYNAEEVGRALAMWAYFYCHDKPHWSMEHVRYTTALDDLFPGTGQYFTEYVRMDDWGRWDASWCGMHVEHQLKQLRTINHLMDLLEKTHRPKATPRDLMQLFTGVNRLFVELKDVDVEQFDTFAKELMQRVHVTHPDADWMWAQ